MIEEHAVYRCDLKGCGISAETNYPGDRPAGWISMWMDPLTSAGFGVARDDGARQFCSSGHAATFLSAAAEALVA